MPRLHHASLPSRVPSTIRLSLHAKRALVICPRVLLSDEDLRADDRRGGTGFSTRTLGRAAIYRGKQAVSEADRNEDLRSYERHRHQHIRRNCVGQAKEADVDRIMGRGTARKVTQEKIFPTVQE